MNNFWLSEFVEKPMMKGEDPEDMMDGSNDSGDSEEPSPKDKLTPRQQSLYEYYESVVEEHGMFDQSSKANGAHYAPSKLNPFAKEGMICGNCVFFEGGQACELVKGNIEPNGICKLWIIPENLITIKK